MEGIKNKLILVFIAFFLITCDADNHSFNKEKWLIEDDEGFPYRSDIVKDLMDNHLDICGSQIEDLLGSAITIHSKKSQKEFLYYFLETRNAWNIDPYYSKFLELKIDEDSCIIESRIVKH